MEKNIIDGVDVDRCQFQNECIKFRNEFVNYNPTECGTYKLGKVLHRENKCMFAQIYKQLQREKQKNEELEAQVQFENKNPIFKQALIYYRTGEHENIIKENKRYKQALKEIEEIAKDLRIRTDYHSVDEVNADIDKILQKIKEVTEC